MADDSIKPLHRKIIIGSNGIPLMVLEKYHIDIDRSHFLSAYSELAKKSKESEMSTWGYFPGVAGNSEESYPRCAYLNEQLTKVFVSKLHSGTERKLELAFIKMSQGALLGSYGGLHVDVTSGVGIIQHDEKKLDMDILRIIINVHEEPRALKYVEIPKEELRKLGVQIDKREYHPIKLPKNINTKIVEIPGIKKRDVWLVKLWSNIVPHVGVTNESGHFVVGLGQYVDRRDECYTL